MTFSDPFKILIPNERWAPSQSQIASSNDEYYVMFSIYRRISKPEIIAFINRANDEFHLSSKELISLGLIAQNNSIAALEFAKELDLPNKPNIVSHWLGRLPDLGLIISKGRTKGTEYMVNPDFLKKTGFKGKTNLKRIENHRLEELIYQDVKIYQPAALGEIHQRIGKEIPYNKIRKTILAEDGFIFVHVGDKVSNAIQTILTDILGIDTSKIVEVRV